MELTSKVEKMELEARKTADRLAEVGVQKDALERDVATMKTESDRLRCVHRTSVALVQLEEMQDAGECRHAVVDRARHAAQMSSLHSSITISKADATEA